MFEDTALYSMHVTFYRVTILYRENLFDSFLYIRQFIKASFMVDLFINNFN